VPRIIMLFIALTLAACGAQSEPGDACYTRSASEFLASSVECTPLQSDNCAFDVHNQPVELDGPLSYYCGCNSAGRYACFGSPGLPPAEPIK